MAKEGLTASQYLYSLLTFFESGGGGGRGQDAQATWTTQGTATGSTSKPSLATDGVPTNGAASTFVGIIFGEATTVSVKIWCYVDGEWGCPRYGELTELTDTYLERTNTVGVERIYIQVTATDGDVTLKIAPVTYL